MAAAPDICAAFLASFYVAAAERITLALRTRLIQGAACGVKSPQSALSEARG
jgi:hypothetical protein